MARSKEGNGKTAVPVVKTEWKNRIVGHAEVDPKTLVPNDANWRKHPRFQREAMSAVLKDIGWVQDIIVNKRTGKLIDGHMRLEISLQKSVEKVPVKFVDLSDEEEAAVLLTLDPISAYANYDRDSVKKLLAKVTTQDATLGNFLETDAENMNVFIDGQFAAAGGTILSDATDEGSSKKDPRRWHEDSEIIGGTYCALNGHMWDIGVGVCSHKCVYCFARYGRGSNVRKDMVEPRKASDLVKMIQKVGQTSRLVQLGTMIDVGLPQLADTLGMVMRAAADNQVYLLLQTKDPASVYDTLVRAKFSPQQVTVNTSFASITDEVAAKLEPGAPLPKDRLAGMCKLIDLGVDCTFAAAPAILGVIDEELEKNQKVLRGCVRMIVQPMKVNTQNIKRQYVELNGLVADGWTISGYFDRYGRRGANATYKSFLDYDPNALLTFYTKMKKIAEKNKLLFGISSTFFGVQFAGLNDGLFCCETPNMVKHKVNVDREALTCKVSQGTADELKCPYLLSKTPDTPQHQLTLWRLAMMNDATRPVLVPGGEKKAKARA